MKELRISDVTMKQGGKEFSLSFKEKIELSKLLDRLGVSVIELEGITNPKIDSLLIKSVATAVKDSVLAVPVRLDEESVQMTWNALKLAKKPRLQVVAGVSPVVMEYVYGKKPEAMLKAIAQTVKACCALCEDVEFVADDATRSDGFLELALQTAIDSGAKTVTVCDTAGTMLPDEFTAFLNALYEKLPQLWNVCVGVSCSDALSMADSCSVAAVRAGAGEVKAAAHCLQTASLGKLARVLSAKSDVIDATCGVRLTELKRINKQIDRICNATHSKNLSHGAQEQGEELYLSVHDDIDAVREAVARLGYELSEEDSAAVYEAFCRIAAKKERVSAKELDAIVASSAMQVPPSYVLDSYVITAGSAISATAHMKLFKNGQPLEGVSIGDGPIDAAFMAIEQIVGRHFELEDFQLQAVTEGREAMGQTVVKLRSEGKLYSGHGISTDIVGAGIRAYLSALNKIVYEEDAV